MANRSNTPSKVVIAGGVFDLPHYAHLRFLKKAKSFGDFLVVALNTDEFVLKYKNKKPILSLLERSLFLEELDFVDKVIVNESNEDWMPTLLKSEANIIVTTTDWEKKDYYKQMGISKKELEEMGVEIKYIPHTEGISTTNILERIYERFLRTKA